MSRRFIYTTTLMLLASLSFAQAPTTYYVDQSATAGTENGLTWANAFLHLRDITDNAALHAGDSIFIAEGTYVPDEDKTSNTDLRTESFNIIDSVVVLGAFPAGGGSNSTRSTSLYTTILSGEIQQDGILTNNAYHVIQMEDNSVLYIDGVTIEAGAALLTSLFNDRGAGMFLKDNCKLFMSNCFITRNRATAFGAGICAYNSDLQLNNCSISINNMSSSTSSGGAIFQDGGQLNINGCTLSNNRASNSGGALHIADVEADIRETTLDLNRPVGTLFSYAIDGGAVFIANSTVDFYHCIFSENRSKNGGAIYTGSSNVTIDRCEFYNNRALDFGGAIYSTVFSGSTSPAIIDMKNSLLHRSVLYGNLARGSAMYLVNGDHFIRNNNFIDNNPTNRVSGHDIYGHSASNLKIDNNIFYENPRGDLLSTGMVTGKNNHINYTGDGNFHAMLSFLDFVPFACSPTINAGSNDLIDPTELDFNGNPRISDGIVDLGAFENSNPIDTNITTFYVRPSSANIINGEGISPTSPFVNLQMALKNVCLGTGDEIRVAAGSNHPGYGPHTMMDDRNSSFIIDKEISIKGGFDPEFNYQDNLQFESILSGAITADTLQNAFSVVTISNSGSGSTIDGVTISGGRADSSPALEHRTGAGIYNFVADLTVQNSTIKNNRAPGNGSDGTGGGYIHFGGTSTFINTIWTGNSSSAQGGAISSQGGSIDVINNTFHGNHSDLGGGAIHTYQGHVNSINTLFSENTAPARNDINQPSLGGTATLSYCMLDADIDTAVVDAGNNITNASFSFYSKSNEDYRLFYCSEGVDVGLNSANMLASDFAGLQRIVDTIDIGAFESPFANEFDGNIFVNRSVNSLGVSWAEPMSDLNVALLLNNTCGVDSIFVATGTYLPSGLSNSTIETRESSFNIANTTYIKGGYSSSGEHNTKLYPTILSGDLQNDTILTNNAYSVVEVGGTGGSTLDGFIIQDGYADTSVTVAARTGAGIYDAGADFNLYNSIIRNNYAIGDSTNGTGGGMISFGGINTYINNLWYDNVSSVEGGALSAQLGSHNLINNTFANNTSLTKGGAIHIYQGNVAAVNSIFSDNAAISNKNINEPNLGGSAHAKYSLFDTALDPFVVDSSDNIINSNAGFLVIGSNYQLSPCSPARNTGLNSANNFSIDICSNNRFIDDIDMGAFESMFDNGPQHSIFVDQSTEGDGSSWLSPLSNLQLALNVSAACNVDTVFIAAGVYYPDEGPMITDNDITARFVIDSSLVMLGSYPTGGGEQSILSHPTILSGEIGDVNTIVDNTKTVLQLNNFARIDGLIIEKGNAGVLGDPGGVGRDGGGIFTNKGGHFSNLILRLNAAVIGGGLCAFSEAITLENCLFHDNHAYAYGGAVGVESTLLTDTSKLVNVSMIGNTEDQSQFGLDGSAIALYQTNLVLINSNIYDHINPFRISTGAQIFVSNSNIQGGYAGTGNIDVDPMFVDTANNNYQLRYGSPLINMGNNSVVSSEKDILGNDRIINSTVDMGAFEFNYEFPCGIYSTLDIDDIPIYKGIYKASGLISSDGEVNGGSNGHVTYISESEIELKPAFEVLLGESFEAKIENPCTD